MHIKLDFEVFLVLLALLDKIVTLLLYIIKVNENRGRENTKKVHMQSALILTFCLILMSQYMYLVMYILRIY